MDIEEDRALRGRIMAALSLAVAASPDGTLTRAQLSALPVDGTPYRLIDQSRGIWNPVGMHGTLSILSSPTGPYSDADVADGLFQYDYRSGGPGGDNTKLRRAYEQELPLILLRKLTPGIFLPVFPVHVVADDPRAAQFFIAMDESLRLLRDPTNPTTDERRYSQRVARQRLHQPAFRARVLQAYDIHCAVCLLKHGNLLDAAHITSDSDEAGLPLVSNGLSLCKIHHAAYDGNLMGISADGQVHIAQELLAEVDGPMLRHGLQEMDGRLIRQPRRRIDRPDRDRLARRFEGFLRAS